MSGPVPERSHLRRRRNKPTRPIVHSLAVPVERIPDPDPEWHPIARHWYESLLYSGQSAFYQESDWATAYVIAESMSRDLNPQFVDVSNQGDVIERTIPMKGASLTAYLRAMGVLLVTEGDRRRLQIELERPDPDNSEHEAKVARMDAYRKAASNE